jgi:hypothetical protein
MSGDDIVGIDALVSGEAIAFYVWVLGVAIAVTWNTKVTSWLGQALEMILSMIIAAAVAIAILCWVGPNALIAVVIMFVVYQIVRAYLKCRKWWRLRIGKDRMVKDCKGGAKGC